LGRITDFISDNWLALASLLIAFLALVRPSYKTSLILSLVAFAALLIIGVSSWQKKVNVKTIERNRKMKRDMEKEFKKPFDPSKIVTGPDRFNCQDIIVKDVNRPERLKPRNEYWWSPKKTEPVRIRDDGFVVIMGLTSGKNKEDKKITLFRIGLIPFKKIKSWDTNTDSGKTVFYCKFSGKFGPFSKISYIPVKEEDCNGMDPFLCIDI